jgi:hypothetical protein
MRTHLAANNAWAGLRRLLRSLPGMLFFVALLAGPASSGVMDGFMDPTDDQFDVSNFLLNKRGFLINPLVITEPAIGYGAGATLLFFHESTTDKNRRKESDGEKSKALGLPPSVSFAIGGGTETKSWLAAGGHFGSFLEDRIRYMGAGGYLSMNVDFYANDRALPYNLDGYLIYQDLQFRVVRSNFFLGARYIYSRFESEFEFLQNLPGSLPSEFDFKMSGIGPVFRYDSRDNIFTASHGEELEIVPLFYAKSIGSSRDYQILQTKARIYRKPFEKLVLAARVDSDFSFGETPFYALPSISARGVSATRYQNEIAISSELQARWQFWRRWSLIGFAGLGWSGGDLATRPASEFVPSGGGGFRYLLARLMNLHMGMDFAGSKDQFAFYFQVGTGW